MFLFDSRLESITFDMTWEAADLKSVSPLRRTSLRIVVENFETTPICIKTINFLKHQINMHLCRTVIRLLEPGNFFFLAPSFFAGVISTSAAHLFFVWHLSDREPGI